jgi:hypothetical protein
MRPRGRPLTVVTRMRRPPRQGFGELGTHYLLRGS